MMIKKRLLVPGRIRQIPPHFSWIDHSLIRHDFLRDCQSAAWALYLATTTVADAQGLSYYSDASLCRMLHLQPQQLEQARQQLLAADVLAYEKPLYQVLDLGKPESVLAESPRTGQSLSAGQILQRILTPGGQS